MLGFMLRTGNPVNGEGPQTERLLRWIALAVLVGLTAIAIGALCRLGAGIRPALAFLAVGLLAALLALVVGGAFGLLFGLPVGAKVVVVGGAQGTPEAGSAATTDAGRDWFGDNNAMEQIVDWLTKIIVGLGLVQAHEIAVQFDRMAAATTRAMGAGDTGSADANEVVGGAILLAYLLLGFTGLFLWARRYLKREWTDERRSRITAQQEDALIERSAAAKTVQSKAKDGSAADSAMAAVDRVRASAEQLRDDVAKTQAAVASSADAAGSIAMERAAAAAAFPDVLPPGASTSDPWAAQFGGVATSGGATLEGSVTALQSRDDQFGVTLALRGTDETARRTLAGHRARLYLHPTFDDPIRMLTFDAAGEIKLSLLCWGSFTVGAQLENGQTLELDLAKLPEAPRLFRER